MNNASLYEQTFYEILEVSPSAQQDEIRRAYQRAKETYSPNSPAIYSMFTPQEASEINKMIEEAFSILGNFEARKRYDLKLLHIKNKNTPNSSEALYTPNMPDIELPPINTPHNVTTIDPTHQTITPTPKIQEIPKGHNKTEFGLYKVDESIEGEIESQSNFDGLFLQKIREYKKIELDVLSQKTRISLPYLRAIESNSYSKLPAAVFVRGFIIHVAKYLGLNEKKVANSYMEKFKAHKK